MSVQNVFCPISNWLYFSLDPPDMYVYTSYTVFKPSRVPRVLTAASSALWILLTCARQPLKYPSGDDVSPLLHPAVTTASIPVITAILTTLFNLKTSPRIRFDIRLSPGDLPLCIIHPRGLPRTTKIPAEVLLPENRV